jgi:hypothetical protein
MKQRKQFINEPIELLWNGFRLLREVSPPPPDRIAALQL